MKKKTIRLFDYLSIYTRDRSKNYYVCVNYNGKQYRKSLKTESQKDARKLAFEYASDITTGKKQLVVDKDKTVDYFAKKLIDRKKNRFTASGISVEKEIKNILNRKNGILEFFKNREVSSITREDCDEFFAQLHSDRVLAKSTINKHRSLLRQILDSAENYVKFSKIDGTKSQRRGFFTRDAYRKLRDKSLELIGTSVKMHNGTKYEITHDLHDFIVFMMSSMLRSTVSEIYSLKYEDINEKTEQDTKTKYLQFTVNRKNQMMSVETLSTGFYIFRDMKKRNKNYKKSDYLFLNEYKNRRHAMRIMSAQFRTLLEMCDLRTDEHGNICTTYSLRHTSIIMNLMNTAITHIQVAKRADTSMKMIEDFYFPQSQLNTDLKEYLRVS